VLPGAGGDEAPPAGATVTGEGAL